jgi:hypothetical protein
MGLRHLIFQAKVVEQSFGAVVLPHHDQQASDDENPTEHGRMLFSNMLLPNLIPLTDVTFSTPTLYFTHWPSTLLLPKIPPRRQLCKYLNLRGHEISARLARKQVFVGRQVRLHGLLIMRAMHVKERTAGAGALDWMGR